MILHDLRCDECGEILRDQYVDAGRFPIHCMTPMRWIPFVIATDVAGSEQVSQVLCEPHDPTEPLKWTSSREREAKMRQQGFVPAGDRYHGALGNSDPAKGRSYVFASDKGSVRSPKR